MSRLIVIKCNLLESLCYGEHIDATYTSMWQNLYNFTLKSQFQSNLSDM